MKNVVRALNKLFNIRTREWPRIILLFFIATLTNAGAIWGLTIVYAAFLNQLGVAALPWITIISSVLSVLALTIYSAFVDRIADGRLLVYIVSLEAVGIVAGLLLLAAGYPLIAYPFLYLLLLSAVAVITPHQITYFNNFYDTQAAKRTIPLISAGFRFGAILAGLTVPLLNSLVNTNSWFDSAVIVVAWLVAHILVILLTLAIPHLLPSPAVTPEHQTPTPAENPSFTANVREGFTYTLQSTYLRWMAIGTLLLMVLMAVLEYRYSEILLAEFGTVAELSEYIGLLAGIGNVFVLPMLLFGIGRLISRFGVGNSTLFFPIGNVVLCGGLVIWPGLATASAAYLNRSAFRLAFQSPIEGLLYNAVPLRVKGRARAFVSGLILPIGSLIGGLLLLIPLVSTAWFVPGLIAILAIAYLLSAFVIRKEYSQALIKMLEQEDYSFLLADTPADFAVTDPATLKSLETRLKESDDPDFSLFMAQLISQIGGQNATPILVEAVHTAQNAPLRAALLDVMVAAEIRDPLARNLYEELLNNEAGVVRQAALSGLEQIDGADSDIFRSKALPLLDDPDVEVQAQVLSALMQTPDFATLPQAVARLNQLVTAADPAVQVRGISLLSQAPSAENCQRLIPLLAHEDDRVRIEIINVLAVFPDTILQNQAHQTDLRTALTHRLSDPVERVRQLAVVLLGRLSHREAYHAILPALTDTSTQVRDAAVLILVQAGKMSIPLVHPLLDSAAPNKRKMAAVVLSQVDQREFSPLIATHVTGNLLAIYRNIGYLQALVAYQEFDSVTVLQSSLAEQNQTLLTEIFYLLSAWHNPDDIKTIADSLTNHTQRVRANALEALESLTTPQLARLIGPLFEPDMSPQALLKLSQETWEMQAFTPETIFPTLSTANIAPWPRAVTLFALGEIGALLPAEASDPTSALLVDDEPPADPEPDPKADNDPFSTLLSLREEREARKNKRTRPNRDRSRRLDPLGALMGLGDDDPTSANDEADLPAEAPPPRQRNRRRVDPLASLAGEPDPPAEAEADLAEVDDDAESHPQRTLPPVFPYQNRTELQRIFRQAVKDGDAEVRLAASSAQRLMLGMQLVEARMAARTANQLVSKRRNRLDKAAQIIDEEKFMLSTIEKVIFLKKVPFFQSMTIDQLKALATVCEEVLFEEDTRIFEEGDPGGTLYVVVSGKVGIEQEGRRKGSYVRLANLGAHSYFGEMNLFDNSSRTASAIALQDTLMLKLRREPLVALTRQYPDLSLELIKVLSQRLRETNDQIVGLSRSKPRELHKLYDIFD